MAERGWRAAALGAAGGLGMTVLILAGTAGARAADAGSWSRDEGERFLREASVVSVQKDAPTGRTLPWIVSLEKGGVKARAVFRYVHRPRPHPMAHSYRYELAAYELSKLLGLDIVPPTIARTIEGVPGALQLFVEGCVSERDFARTGSAPSDPRILRDSLDTVRLFEGLSGDACGNKDDTFIHPETCRACRVDLAEAFPPNPALSEDCSISRCPKSLYEKMLRMDPASTKKKLRAWLSDDEIDGLCGRKRQIVAGLMELIKARGEAAVLYPPRPRP